MKNPNECRQPLARKPLGGISASAVTFSVLLSSSVVADSQSEYSDPTKPEHPQNKSTEQQRLSPIVVSGEEQENAPLIHQNESVQSGKSSVSIQDTPASISVVKQEFIQNTGAKNLQDALLYSSGVYAGNFGFDTRGDWTKVRGLDASNYVDGLRSIYGYYNSVRPNIYAYESVEVLKGPSSVLYGQSELGGIINTVSKLPNSQQQGEIWGQVGSFDRKQFATDVTGPLTGDGEWLYRLIVLHRNSGTQVDHVDDDGYVLAPSLTWRPNSDTTMTLLGNIQESEGGVSAQFLPTRGTLDSAPRGDIPVDTFVGEPSWDRYDRNKSEFSFFLDHRLNQTWNLSTILRRTQSEAITREHWSTVGAIPDDAGNIVRTIYMVDRATDVLNADVRAEGNFQFGPTQHTLAIGLDRQDARWDEGNYYSGRGEGGIINLYEPEYGNVNRDVLNPQDRTDNEIEQLGLYIIDHMEVGNTVISTALRRDNSKNTELHPDGSSTETKDNVTSGRVGLMYRFEFGFSPYVSYSEAFVPNLGSDGTGEGGSLKPTTGEQKEVGFKYLSNNEDTSLTFAWFDIEQENRVSQGDIPGGVKQTGATVKGWEMEAKKHFGPLELLFNYADLDAMDESTDTRLPYVAEKTASFWSLYRFDHGFRAGFGARYTGNTVGWGGAPRVPSVSLYDLMFGYSTGAWDFSINAKNLEDEKYVSWCRSEGADCGYGERRNLTGNVRYRF